MLRGLMSSVLLRLMALCALLQLLAAIARLPWCGLQEVHPRLSNGATVPGGHWPWLARIMQEGTETELGAGALITDRLVLTDRAALLLDPTNDYDIQSTEYYAAKDLVIRLGEDSVIQTNRLLQVIPVQSLIVSTQMAILCLTGAVRFTVFVRPICLPAKSYFFRERLIGHAVWMAGFGSASAFAPSQLTQAQMQVVDSQHCKGHNNFLCLTGYNDTGASACQGDVGGAIAYQYDCRWYHVATVRSSRCNRTNGYDYGPKTSDSLAWILAVVNLF